MRFRLPIRTWSEPNMTSHSPLKLRRTKAQSQAVAMHCAPLRYFARPPYAVTLTRIAPKQLAPDNLKASFESVRGEIAALLGIDDGSEALSWRYLQRKGSKPREYAVEIEVEAVGMGVEAGA